MQSEKKRIEAWCPQPCTGWEKQQAGLRELRTPGRTERRGLWGGPWRRGCKKGMVGRVKGQRTVREGEGDEDHADLC